VSGDGHGEAYTAIVWVVGVSLEMAILRRPRPSMVSKATCAGPICEVLSLRRGLGPHHARREHVGTWETSLRPQPSLTVQGRDGKPRRRSRQGRNEGSDGVVVPVKRPNKAGMTSGGGRGGKDPARKEREWTVTDSGPSAGPRLNSAALAHGPARMHRMVRVGHVALPRGARCGKAARRDLRGGREVIPVPTATAAK